MSHSFGWVNASYVYGLTIVNTHMKRALGALTPWDTFHRMTEHELAVVEDFAGPPPAHAAAGAQHK